MSLHENIAGLKSQIEQKLPATTRAIMDQATSNLKSSGIMDGVVKVGEALPTFTLPNQDGVPFNLERILVDGPLVVSIFRGAWCPYCMLELEALEKEAQGFRDAGATLLIISPQSQAASAKMKADKGFSFDILSDLGNLYTQRLGLVFSLPDALRKVYSGIGIDLPAFNGTAAWELPMPARLVVGKDGVVRDANINADYTNRPEPKETLRVLKSAL